MKKILFTTFLLAGVLSAQEGSRTTFNIGAGFTTPVGGTGRRLDTGFNFDAAAGMKLVSHLDGMIEFNFNDMGVNRPTLTNLGYPDGSVRVWSLTLDPVVHLKRTGPVKAYLIGGGGLYHRTQEFTQPTVATVIGFDPFFGYGAFAVPANQVLASYSVNKPGVNGGLGLAFGEKWHGKFYGEARYHRMFLNYGHFDYVTTTFGFRW